MPERIIFTVGGTVQAGGGLYLERTADQELLEFAAPDRSHTFSHRVKWASPA